MFDLDISTHSNQSAVIISETSLVGSPTVVRMTKIETRPAGTEFKPRDAIVAMKLKSKNHGLWRDLDQPNGYYFGD